MTTEMAQGSSALKTFYTTTPTTLESGRQSGNDDSSHYQPPFVSIPEGQTEIKQYEKFVFTAYSGEMFDLPVPVNKSFRVEVERVSPRSVWLFGNDNGLSRIQGFSLFRSVGQYSFVLRALEDDSILGEGVLHIRLRDGDQACERNHYFITEQNVPMGLNDTISIIRSRVEPRVSADTANSHINDTVVVLRVQLNRDLHTVEWMSRLLLERGVTCRDVKHDELVAVYVELDEDQKHFTTFISDCRSWLRWFSQITVSLLVLLMVTIMILTCLWAFYRPVSALGTNSCDDSRCSS